ncbi:MAG: beta-propeller fold lactonase family protein [Lachnospiraceae bacterium]
MVRCELESAPRFLRFSPDGRFMYVICELKNYITVYSYQEKNGLPCFEPLRDRFHPRQEAQQRELGFCPTVFSRRKASALLQRRRQQHQDL